MAVVENRFVCDLSKPVQAQALKGNVFSLDNLGSRLSVLIVNNGVPATISGSVTANCILPDGSTVNVNGTLTTENGGSKAYVDIPQGCLLIPGILKIAIKCTSSSVITTLAAIVANVYMTKTDNVITPSQQLITDWNAEISSAIATQNATIESHGSQITAINNKIGNTTLPTTAQTLTGAIAEHQSDLTTINNKIGDTTLPTTAQTLTGAIAEHEGDLTNQQGQISDLKSAFNAGIQKSHGLNILDISSGQRNYWYTNSYTTGDVITGPTSANKYIAVEIPIDAGETKISVKASQTGSYDTGFAGYFVDSDNKALSSRVNWGGSYNTLSGGATKDIPANAVKLLVSIYNGTNFFDNGGKIMVNYGEDFPVYVDYQTLYMLGGRKVLFNETDLPTFLTEAYSANLFDISKGITPAWYYTTGETISSPTSLSSSYKYMAYAVENVEQYAKISIKGYCPESNFNITHYYFTNSSDEILEHGSINHATMLEGSALTVPANAKRLLLSIGDGAYLVGSSEYWLMINAGTASLPYEPYELIYYINGKRISGINNGSITTLKLADKAVTTEKLKDGAVTPEKLSGVNFDNAKLKCPSTITAIVGDTIELFYKGLINAYNTDDYAVDISFANNANHGKNWKRKFSWKPVASDIGTHTMNVKLLSNTGEEIDSASIIVNVVAEPSSPSSQKVVLCVGDSLTSGGKWPVELHRRLTGNGGTPAGYNLNNLTFIGSKEKDGVKYEGYGGWTFLSYNTANTSDAYMWITCTHDKTDADQHSVYKDANNVQWYLETIEQERIKIIRVSGSGTLPSTGTLTWVSGGEHTSNIVYTASEQAEGNPFWDSQNNQNDFAAYATRMGVSSIDYCLILLGWNSTTWSESTYKTQANAFIDRLLTQFPSCKVILLGLEVPSYDGIANSYGISWKYWEKLQFVWNLNGWYEDIADDNSSVIFANVCSQFDTEYNMQTRNMAVNIRNDETVTVQNNGVHPADSGYLQIADVALRAMAGIM